jgi:regulator of protease activity HflC (stomatin/prohibitin superfamily)
MKGLTIMTTTYLFLIGLAALILLTFRSIVKIVPQSEQWVVERFGRYKTTLTPGLSFIFPYIDNVRHKVSILERQLPHLAQDAITKDNVTLQAEVAVFYRVVRPENSVYRIRDIDAAVSTTVAGLVRSEIGQIELDEVQSNRQALNSEIREHLAEATDEWGIQITRSEILDVNLDAQTRDAMLQQLNAERERRATVARAEGVKRAKELEADAELYTAQRIAEARRVQAEADAFATETVARAIENNGERAIQFEIAKRQVEGITAIGASDNAKFVLLPGSLTEAFGDPLKKFLGKSQS